MPAASPASTKLQYRLSKYIGYLRKALLSEVPVSTSVRTSLSSLVTLALALPRPTISKACSKGTPAFIMVANWRVKMAMSLGLIRFPARMRLFLILVGKTPWRRNVACTWFSPTARISPRTGLPWRSLPSHSKMKSLMPLDAAVAMAVSLDVVWCYSLVTARISSSEVSPSLTLCSPACRSERTPSRRACSEISSSVPSARMMRWMSSVTGITW